MQSRSSIDVVKILFWFRWCLQISYIGRYFTVAVLWVGWWVGVAVGGGGVEKLRLKLTSAKVEVEVEAEIGKNKSRMVLPVVRLNGNFNAEAHAN